MATTIQKRIKFSKGEINPLLSERTDIDLLDNGASYIKNYHQTIFGGLKTRLGTKRVDAIRNIVNQIETPTVEILFKNKIEDTTTLFKITAINKDNRFINFKINNIHFDKHKETKLEYEFETFEEEEHYEETNEEGETIDKIRVNTYYRLKTINILEAGNNYSIEPNIYFTNNTDNNDIIPQLKATISNRTLTSIEIFNSGKLTSIDNIKLTIEQPEEFNTTLNIIDNNNEILNTFTITEEPQDINITLAERQDKIIIERINNLYFDTTLLLDNFNFNVNKPIITSNIGGNLNNCLKKFESDAIGTKTGELLNIKFDAPVNYINFKINIRKSRKCILDTYCGMSVYKNGRYNIIFGNDKEDFMLLYRNSSSGNVIIVDKGYGYKDGIYDLIITKNVFPYERWESEPRAKAVVKNNEVVEIIDRHGYILNEPKSMIYSQKNYSLACNLPLADELLNQKLSIELQGKNNNEWETIESYLLTGDYIFINPVSLIGYNEFRIVRTGNNDLTTRLIIEDFNYGTVGNFSKDAVAIPFSNNKENYLLLICEGFILIYKNEILNNTIQVNEIKREHLENLKYTQMGNNIILTEGNLHPLILTLDNNNNWSIRKINIKFIPYYQFNKNDETLINNVILTPSATEGAIYLISNIDFFTKDLEGQIIDAGVGNGNNGGRFKIIKFENSKKVYSKTIIPFYEKTSFTNFTLIKGFEPVWSEIRGYPNACLYYQERLWFGGTGLVPLGLWGSRTGQYNDFNNIGNYDNDGIDIELSSKLQGEIVDLYGNRGLQIFTTEAEFVAGDNNLTPNTIAISQVSSIGSRRNTGVFDLSGITLFVDKKGLNLNTFVYDFSQDSYCSKVLTLLNNTPIKNPKRLAVDYNSNFENGNYIYLVNEDGTMAVINVLLDENINSMTRFETLNGEVKDCISFNNKTYLIVERNEGLFLEVMDNVKTDFTVEVGAVNGIITGLQYYNKVRVYNNQKDYGTFEVIDGTIDLQNTNINETLNIGLDIACRIISNDIIINNQTNNIKSRIAKVIITTTPETNEIIFNNHKHKPSRKEYEDNIFELYGVSNYETKNRFEIKSIFNQLEIKSILLYINYGEITMETSLLNNTSSFMYGASALASIIGAGINYNLMKIQNNNLAIQANQIELQAEQELNQYREQFNSNLAQIQYNSSLRGIKQSSGVIQNSVMKLSEDVGDNFNIIRNNATLQANALRSQQSINKRTNRANLYGSIAGTLMGTGAKLYDNSLLNDKINSLNNSII